jgi:hypothetical protein
MRGRPGLVPSLTPLRPSQTALPAGPGFLGDVDDTIPSLLDGGEGVTDGGGTAEPLKGGDAPAAKSCDDICGRAYADSSLNSGGGGVICDGSTKCACVFDVAPLKKGQCPGFDNVVLSHEQHHLTDVDCDPKGGLHRPHFRDQSKAEASECTHRKESIAQMDAIIPKAAGTCKTGMQDIRNQLQTWVTAHCGSSGSGSGSGSGH